MLTHSLMTQMNLLTVMETVLETIPTPSQMILMKAQTIDSDGVGDNSDAFPDDSNETTDTDGDGVGDNSDICSGGDDLIDADGDSVPDFCDPLVDSDGDGIDDEIDAFPNDITEWVDSDGDGVGSTQMLTLLTQKEV